MSQQLLRVKIFSKIPDKCPNYIIKTEQNKKRTDILRPSAIIAMFSHNIRTIFSSVAIHSCKFQDGNSDKKIQPGRMPIFRTCSLYSLLSTANLLVRDREGEGKREREARDR